MAYLRRNKDFKTDKPNENKDFIKLMAGREILGSFDNWKDAENALMLAIKENQITKKYFDKMGHSTLRLE